MFIPIMMAKTFYRSTGTAWWLVDPCAGVQQSAVGPILQVGLDYPTNTCAVSSTVACLDHPSGHNQAPQEHLRRPKHSEQRNLYLRSGHVSGLDRVKQATNSFPAITQRHRLLFGISTLDHLWGWSRGAMHRFYGFLVPKSSPTSYRVQTDEIP